MSSLLSSRSRSTEVNTPTIPFSADDESAVQTTSTSTKKLESSMDSSIGSTQRTHQASLEPPTQIESPASDDPSIGGFSPGPSLPVEILAAICDHLKADGAFKTLGTLMRVGCLADLAAPRLYETLHITRQNFESILHGLPRASTSARNAVLPKGDSASYLELIRLLGIEYYPHGWPNVLCPSEDESDSDDPKNEWALPTVCLRRQGLLGMVRKLIFRELPKASRCSDMLVARDRTRKSLFARVETVALGRGILDALWDWEDRRFHQPHPLLEVLACDTSPHTMCIDEHPTMTKANYVRGRMLPTWSYSDETTESSDRERIGAMWDPEKAQRMREMYISHLLALCASSYVWHNPQQPNMISFGQDKRSDRAFISCDAALIDTVDRAARVVRATADAFRWQGVLPDLGCCEFIMSQSLLHISGRMTPAFHETISSQGLKKGTQSYGDSIAPCLKRFGIAFHSPLETTQRHVYAAD